MRNFSKTPISVLLIVLCIVIMSALVLIYPDIANISLSEEREERLSYAGNIDCVFIGASHCQCAFAPLVVDKELGCFSYNLAQDSINNCQKLMLLKNEFARNPIKTLVIEVSFDTLIKRSTRVEYTDAIMTFSNRLDNTFQRCENFIKYTSFDNWQYVFANTMVESISKMIENKNSSIESGLKGGSYHKESSYVLETEEIDVSYETIDIFSKKDINNDLLDAMDNMISLGKENGCRVVLVVVPVSDNYIWKLRNLDEFRAWMEEYCQNLDVEYYDFNLIKNRYELFDDEYSYSTDIKHMSEKGALEFSKLFCDTIKKAEECNDISSEFYTTYEEMKKDSPYWRR